MLENIVQYHPSISGGGIPLVVPPDAKVEYHRSYGGGIPLVVPPGAKVEYHAKSYGGDIPLVVP